MSGAPLLSRHLEKIVFRFRIRDKDGKLIVPAEIQFTKTN